MSFLGLFQRNKPAPGMSGADYIVCFLGNPGEKYAGTRHNIGFVCADFLSEKHGAKINKIKFHGLYGELNSGGVKLVLLKPATYMNRSGQSARAALDFYKLPPDRLIAVCDDVSLPCGRLRVRAGGSSGGQKGLESIIEHTGTEAFPRIRIGVGRPPNPEYGMADWVLSRFGKADRDDAHAAAREAADAVVLLAQSGVEAAANRYNGQKQ